MEFIPNHKIVSEISFEERIKSLSVFLVIFVAMLTIGDIITLRAIPVVKHEIVLLKETNDAI